MTTPLGKIIRLEDRVKVPISAFALRLIEKSHGPEVFARCAAQMKRDEFAPHVARAVVNASRWIVRCPAVGCAGATIIPTGCDRFFCTDCLNAAWAGRWLPVVWPDEATAIERVLMCRPAPGHRNWDPHESVADLEAQNLERGDPIGRDA